MRRLVLFVEFAALFFAMPMALRHLMLSGAMRWVIPILWAASALAATWLVCGRGWTLEKFFGFAGVVKRDWLLMLLRVAAAAPLLCACLWAVLKWGAPPTPAPGGVMFGFVRMRPSTWAVVMLAYPLLSVVPQGVVYRALFFERYAPLFGRWAGGVAVLAFSMAHVVFNNPHALVLTLAGGAVFTWQYRKTGSLMFANVEHALMGDLAFTVGWGLFLHAGTLAMAKGGG